jgi:hypothetical protein
VALTDATVANTYQFGVAALIEKEVLGGRHALGSGTQHDLHPLTHHTLFAAVAFGNRSAYLCRLALFWRLLSILSDDWFKGGHYGDGGDRRRHRAS